MFFRGLGFRGLVFHGVLVAAGFKVEGLGLSVVGLRLRVWSAKFRVVGV